MGSGTLERATMCLPFERQLRSFVPIKCPAPVAQEEPSTFDPFTADLPGFVKDLSLVPL